jgi:hypothetical protein
LSTSLKASALIGLIGLGIGYAAGATHVTVGGDPPRASSAPAARASAGGADSAGSRKFATALSLALLAGEQSAAAESPPADAYQQLSTDELLDQLKAAVLADNVPADEFYAMQQPLVDRASQSPAERERLIRDYLSQMDSKEADVYLAILQKAEMSTESLTIVADRIAQDGDPSHYRQLVDTLSYGAEATDAVQSRLGEVIESCDDECVLDLLRTVPKHRIPAAAQRSALQKLERIVGDDGAGDARAQAFDELLSMMPHDRRAGPVITALRSGSEALVAGAIAAIGSGRSPFDAQVRSLLVDIAMDAQHPLRAHAAHALTSRDYISADEAHLMFQG